MKRGDHGKKWTEKHQPSQATVNVFDANKVLVYVHSIQDYDGQECV